MMRVLTGLILSTSQCVFEDALTRIWWKSQMRRQSCRRVRILRPAFTSIFTDASVSFFNNIWSPGDANRENTSQFVTAVAITTLSVKGQQASHHHHFKEFSSNPENGVKMAIQVFKIIKVKESIIRCLDHQTSGSAAITNKTHTRCTIGFNNWIYY